ncbi:MAG: acetylxylan esterase [Planctomycetaceae bacterium]|nr:acetylxylan esterase [Planctomycetales bacterium]MCB9924027.1 acetylxylan esterase [Planctomycetaceae bacterium]
MSRSHVLLAVVLLNIASPALPNELFCLPESERESSSLYSALQAEAYAALDRRTERYEQLKTPEQIRDYQQQLREFFIRQLGGLPERTPLNATTVRTIQADGYRIELVIYESQPHHHITANLYIPDGDGPFPGVVVSSGHSRTAKTADYNQRFGIMMAKHGMAALCFDPIGQGERSQVLDDQGHPKYSGTTTEHFLLGVGSTLVGRSTATYRVWDGIRSIDYLVSRPEIDPTRIGYTGCSGGGTLTSYVMALDERVTCAAPACYLTTFRKLIETIGPQDAEQNIFGQVAFGLDHPDYILMRAPRPTLICCTTGDYFNIEGAWNNYRQAKRVYGQLGYPERVDLVEMDGPHGVKPQGLATIAHWMKRWLLDRDEAVPVAELTTRAPSELLCTSSGQVLRLAGEKSVFDLNAELEARLATERERLWTSKTDEAMTTQIARRLGLDPIAELKPPKLEDAGRVQRGEYHIDRLVLRPESGVPLPGLTFHPKSPLDDAYLYLHDSGKLGDSEPGGAIEQLVNDGYAVVSLDLRGQGETATGDRDKLLTDWKIYYLAFLLGKPLLGMRVEDALSGGHFVAYYQKPADKPRRVHLIGVGQAGIVALHAAALHPELFASVTLRNTPRNWASVVKQSNPEGQLDSVIHGALETYDLPDLVRLIGDDKVTFE